jgi:hypothetical protein
MQYIVRFQRIPTNFSAKEALVIEADDPVDAIMVMRDHLLRRGDDPDGFVPSIGFHLQRLAEYQRDGVNHPDVVRKASYPDPRRTPEEDVQWSLAYHRKAMEEQADRYVEPYLPVPGRVVGRP